MVLLPVDDEIESMTGRNVTLNESFRIAKPTLLTKTCTSYSLFALSPELRPIVQLSVVAESDEIAHSFPPIKIVLSHSFSLNPVPLLFSNI